MNESPAQPPYRMYLSLNVLNHLGLNLYSNIPAVISEAVANAWDADALIATINIDIEGRTIVIEDNGVGMTPDEINDKYLFVGYRRRESGEGATEKGRRVMGRKGIGKLSLFSIADIVELHTVKEGKQSALRMSLPDIRAAIDAKGRDYNPTPLQPDDSLKKGTRITLREIRKRLTAATATHLRRRLARRFSVLGDPTGFDIQIDGKVISPADRDYYHKIQYVWTYGPSGAKYGELCTNAEKIESRGDTTSSGHKVEGWIGTVFEVKQLKDEEGESLNKIVVLVRGKLAQEDLLEEFGEGGVYSKYLVGEIHADFLDVDNESDIATSSRQKFIEDDPRVLDLKDFVRDELKHIQSRWTDLRNEAGEQRAVQLIPRISDWIKQLRPDERKPAATLFGKINRLPIDDPDAKKDLIKHAVLAFEGARLRKNLRALNDISVENLAALGPIFQTVADLEATLYHQIVKERLDVIRALQQKVDEGALEKLVQQHIFDNLWLLDPSWERATETPIMEKRVQTAFEDMDAELTREEREARLDIKYRKAVGRHIVIELKRSTVVTETSQLLRQVQKYESAIRKIMEAQGIGNETLEIVCLVGQPLRDWDTPANRQKSDQALAQYSARVLMYDELLRNAYNAYKDFLDREEDIGAIRALIDAIEGA